MIRILRKPEVCRLTGLSRLTIDRMEAAGTFPARRLVGDRAVGWLESEVEEWITSRPAGKPPARRTPSATTLPPAANSTT